MEIPVEGGGGLVGLLRGDVVAEGAVKASYFAVEGGLLVDACGKAVEEVGCGVGFVACRQARGEEDLRGEGGGGVERVGGVVLAAETGGEFYDVVVAGEEVDVALGIGYTAEGLDAVGGVAIELEYGVEDCGVVDAWYGVGGGVGVVGTVDEFPFAQMAGDLFELGFDTKIPGAKECIADEV